MCNTSIFQQKRYFNKVGKEIGLTVSQVFQLSPRKFEVIYNNPKDIFFGRTETYHFYFGDEVKYKKIH